MIRFYPLRFFFPLDPNFFFFLLCWWISSCSTSVKMTKLSYLNSLMVTDEATFVTSMACELQMLKRVILHIKLLPKCWLKAMCRNVLFILFPCAYLSSIWHHGRRQLKFLHKSFPSVPASPAYFHPPEEYQSQMLHHSKVHSTLQEIVLFQGNIPWAYTVHSRCLMAVTVPVLWKDSKGSCLIADSKTVTELKKVSTVLMECVTTSPP